MARKRSAERERQGREVARFLEELYREAGFSSWAEFARKSGMLATTLSDYKRGENTPGGYNLVRLIQAARREKAAADETAALRTDPVIAEALQMIRAMGLPLPDPATISPEMEEHLSLVEAWEADGRQGPQPSLAAHRGEVREVAVEIVREIREQLLPDLDDVRERVERLEEAAAPQAEDPPAADGGG